MKDEPNRYLNKKYPLETKDLVITRHGINKGEFVPGNNCWNDPGH